MIDFRYHLVSLVAVFLALAVGIVLGAGPLAQPIGDTLTGQVDKLREDRNALSEKLNQTRSELAADERLVEQLSGRIFNGILKDQAIALIVMPGVEGNDPQLVSEKITQAGGTISAQINLQKDFFSPKKQAYREALSAQITQYLEDKTRVTTAESILAAAVGQLVFVGQNEALSGIMTVEDTPLIQVAAPAAQPARAVVIVGPRAQSSVKKNPVRGGADTVEQLSVEEQHYLDFANTLGSFNGGAVVVGSSQSPDDLVSLLRRNSSSVSTVDGIGGAIPLAILPFALTATMSGTVGAWGTGEQASALVPPIVPVAVPTPVQQPAQVPAQ